MGDYNGKETRKTHSRSKGIQEVSRERNARNQVPHSQGSSKSVLACSQEVSQDASEGQSSQEVAPAKAPGVSKAGTPHVLAGAKTGRVNAGRIRRIRNDGAKAKVTSLNLI